MLNCMLSLNSNGYEIQVKWLRGQASQIIPQQKKLRCVSDMIFANAVLDSGNSNNGI